MKIISWLIALLLILMTIGYLMKEKKTDLYVFFNHRQNVLEDLEANLPQIHAIMPVWSYVKNAEGDLGDHSPEQLMSVKSLINAKHSQTKIIPVLNNHDGTKWQGVYIEEILKNPAKQNHLINQIILYLKKNEFSMINLDFESFSDDVFPNYLEFLQLAASKLHAENLQIALCISPHWFDLFNDHIGQSLDLVVLMLYDEHWNSSPPGPIASLAWFEKMFLKLYPQFPPEKILVGLGNYGYDWPPEGEASDLSILDTQLLAKKHGAQIIVDPASHNPLFHYVDENKLQHQVWFLNGETFLLQTQFLQSYPIRGIALWQLGMEDPELWSKLTSLKR